MTKHLVIIPGLSDHGELYTLTKPYWKRHGFTTDIFLFGWNEDVLSFDTAHKRLLDFIDTLSGDVYIIGVSAGGVAAVNALAARPAIRKVTTVSSPYLPIPHLKNKLLKDSIEHLQPVLAGLSTESKTKILSLHGIFDQVVYVPWSKPTGIQSKQVFAFRHVPSVVLTTTLYKRIIENFFATP